MKKYLRGLLGAVLLASSVALVLLPGWLPLDVEREVNLSFLEDEPKSKVFLYFGYPECGESCPRILSLLAKENRSDLAVWLVNLNPEAQDGVAAVWAKSAHAEFNGFQPDRKQLSALAREFGLKFNRNTLAHNSKGYWINRRGDDWVLENVTPKPWLEDESRLAALLQ